MNTVATFCLLFCASAYAYSAQVSNCSNEDALIIPSDQLLTEVAELALDQPWENYFLSAPTAITLLGTISVLSGKTDFRLDERPRNFTYIRNPSSFRATMTQVANDGWDAFYLAHRNMDSISLNMGMIPRRIQTAVRIIQQSPASVFQRMLRLPLEGIQEISKLCVDLARATENKFLEVMLMLGEVLEVTQVAGTVQDYRLRQAQNELAVAEINKANLEKQINRYEQQRAEMNKEVEKWQQAYTEALDKIPTGWKAIRMGLVRDLGKALSGLCNIFGSGSRNSGPFSPGSFSGNSALTGLLSFEQQWFNSQLSMFRQLTSDATEYLQQGLSNGNATKGNFQKLLDTITPIQTQVNKLAEKIQSAGKLTSLLKRMKNVLQRAVSKSDSFTEQATAEERDSMRRDADAIQTELSTIKEESVSNAQGGYHNQQPDDSVGSNERAKAASAQAMYQFHQRRADENFANMMQSYEAMSALMGHIASLDLARVDTQEIVKLIRECLGYLNDIRAQWAVLTQFFGAVAVRTETMFNQTVVPFIQYVHVFGEPGDVNENARALLLEILKPYIRSVQIAANYLHTLSKTYVTVSSNYILTQLAGVSGLSALPEAQREVKIRELRNNNMVVQGQIVALVKEKTTQYNQTLTAGLLTNCV